MCIFSSVDYRLSYRKTCFTNIIANLLIYNVCTVDFFCIYDGNVIF